VSGERQPQYESADHGKQVDAPIAVFGDAPSQESAQVV